MMAIPEPKLLTFLATVAIVKHTATSIILHFVYAIIIRGIAAAAPPES